MSCEPSNAFVKMRGGGNLDSYVSSDWKRRPSLADEREFSNCVRRDRDLRQVRLEKRHGCGGYNWRQLDVALFGFSSLKLRCCLRLPLEETTQQPQSNMLLNRSTSFFFSFTIYTVYFAFQVCFVASRVTATRCKRVSSLAFAQSGKLP